MRVGVIRGDVTHLMVGDVETVSQFNPDVETRGQERYLKRPTVASVKTVLSALGLNPAQAAALITATLPVGGPLDLRDATITGAVTGSSSYLEALRDAIAPHFVETDVAKKSVKLGQLSGYLKSTYSPDPTRHPALSQGAAIAIVTDGNSNTAFTVANTAITAAVHNTPSAGAIRITGTEIGNSEVEASVVRVTSANGAKFVRLPQATIEAAGGSVSSTVINVPASLLNGLGVAGSKVVVQYTSLVTNTFTVT